MNDFTVITSEDGHDILYRKREPLFNLTKNYLMAPGCKIQQIAVREAKVSEINKWRRVVSPHAFTDLNRYSH